ncbi:MAG: Gfo/Idh/MocA family oxidoreductase, partial [Planctomycetes bacterium]|nr:Gfo/Idh/MocA family oxidoreductase [Planctomycetota bacterium]
MLQVGLLGAGDVAELHAAAVQRCAGAELRSLWNRSAGRGRERAEQFGCRFVATAEALVEDPALDCVFVLTNLETHRHFADLAMRHGKHVLVEKP